MGSIKDNVLGCLRAFTALRDALRARDDDIKLSPSPSEDQPPPLTLREVQDEEARFKVWCGNIGAHQDGRRSLEYRLRDASHIRKQVIKLLSNLAESLEDARSLTSGEMTPLEEKNPDSEADDDDDDEDFPGLEELGFESEIAQVFSDIVDSTNCLLRLSMTIRNPAPHDRFLQAKATSTTHNEPWDIKHVQNKFPQAGADLTERMGTALSRRRQYFKYRQSHHHKLAHGIEADGEDGRTHQEAQSTVASSIPLHLKASADKGGQESTPDVLDEDRLSDSGASLTSYATSVSTGDKLRVPKLPKEAESGPFECSFCYMIISTTTQHTWKKHVYADLRPYVCLWKDCATPHQQYQRRSHWMNHVLQNHWRAWHCSLGCGSEFSSSAEVKAHIGKSHPEMAASTSLDTLVSLGEKPKPMDAPVECPLCHIQLASIKEYGRHVGKHQAETALFALPRIEDGEEDGEDEVSVDSDASSLSERQVSDGEHEEDQNAGDTADDLLAFELTEIETVFNTELKALAMEFIANPPTDASELRAQHRGVRNKIMETTLFELDSLNISQGSELWERRRQLIRNIQQLLMRLDDRLQVASQAAERISNSTAGDEQQQQQQQQQKVEADGPAPPVVAPGAGASGSPRPPTLRSLRPRRPSEPSDADDFSSFAFKNLPVLEKAGREVQEKLRAQALAAQDRPSSPPKPAEKSSDATPGESSTSGVGGFFRRIFGRSREAREPTAEATESAAESPVPPDTVRLVRRKVVPGLPRAATFKRQQSETRSKLEPIYITSSEQRARSSDRAYESEEEAVRGRRRNRLAPQPSVSPPAFRVAETRPSDEPGDFDGLVGTDESADARRELRRPRRDSFGTIRPFSEPSVSDGENESTQRRITRGRRGNLRSNPRHNYELPESIEAPDSDRDTAGISGASRGAPGLASGDPDDDDRETMKRARIILKYEQELAERQQREDNMARLVYQEAIMAEVKSKAPELMRQKEEGRSSSQIVQNIPGRSSVTEIAHRLVDPQLLIDAGERFTVQGSYFVIQRVMTMEEVHGYILASEHKWGISRANLEGDSIRLRAYELEPTAAEAHGGGGGETQDLLDSHAQVHSSARRDSKDRQTQPQNRQIHDSEEETETPFTQSEMGEIIRQSLLSPVPLTAETLRKTRPSARRTGRGTSSNGSAQDELEDETIDITGGATIKVGDIEIKAQGGGTITTSRGRRRRRNSLDSTLAVSGRSRSRSRHICEQCDPPRNFMTADLLRRHQLRHQEPRYPCPVPGCTAAFHVKRDLERHRQARHRQTLHDPPSMRPTSEKPSYIEPSYYQGRLDSEPTIAANRHRTRRDLTPGPPGPRHTVIPNPAVDEEPAGRTFRQGKEILRVVSSSDDEDLPSSRKGKDRQRVTFSDDDMAQLDSMDVISPQETERPALKQVGGTMIICAACGEFWTKAEVFEKDSSGRVCPGCAVEGNLVEQTDTKC